jgi:sigma-E factor negative regulatory protein RseC
MSSSNCIEQKGVIKEIEKGSAKVLITSYSSCSNCESKIACGIGESVTKEIDVPIASGLFFAGEHVLILMKRSMGLKAVGIAYLIPFIILITSLSILSSLQIKELLTGIISIGILIPYFIILFFFKRKINRIFSFSLKKIN